MINRISDPMVAAAIRAGLYPPTPQLSAPRKAAKPAKTYRAARRNAMKNTKRERMSRAERLALAQGAAKFIERKE